MQTYDVILMDPDGFTRAVQVEADSAQDAEGEAGRQGLIHWYEQIYQVRLTPAPPDQLKIA